MRSLKENSNIIKTFMIKGAEHFYLHYYMDGDGFIKQSYIPNKKVQAVIENTRKHLEHSRNVNLGDLEDKELMDLTKIAIQNKVLSELLDIKKEEITEDVLLIYQYIADIIVGQPNVMLKMVADIAENNEIDEETIEVAELNVYQSIVDLIMNINRQEEFIDENKEF